MLGPVLPSVIGSQITETMDLLMFAWPMRGSSAFSPIPRAFAGSHLLIGNASLND